MKLNLIRNVTFSGTAALFFFSLLCSCRSESPVHTPPNILFILSDDHTTQAISSYGGILSKVADTRHVDQIAAEGMRFTSAFCTNSICSPSRATLLTGKYSHLNGVYILGERFDSTQLTSTRIFKEAGYQTAVFGKWHLGSVPADVDAYKVLPVQGRYRDPQFIENGSDTLITHRGWSTDLIADFTMDYIRNRDPNKPFFVMCQFKATHDPWASRPPYDTLFDHMVMPEPDNLEDTYENRASPSRITTLKLELMNQSTYPHHRLDRADDLTQRRFIYQQYIKSFLRCGRVLDENVGRIIEFLRKEGLDQNTIVIYTADQGHFLGEHGFFSKRFMYEESMRIPLIVKYPGHVQPGSVNHDLVANIDIAPTLLDLAGLPVPEEMQGESILPLLEGKTPEHWRKAIYYRYWQHILHRDVTAHYGIRTSSHKLIYFYGRSLGKTEESPVEPCWEFYDLDRDPHEMNNLYDDPEYQPLIKRLKEDLIGLKEQYGDQDSIYPEMVEINQHYFW
ncbi:MAG: sulfatase family protein [Bacteroidales bacterium]